MMKNIVLRDYQMEMLQDLHKAWKRKQSIMVQMPTGTGKTVLLADVICKEINSKDLGLKGVVSQIGNKSTFGNVLVVAHRRELIAQISQTLNGFGVEHGLIVSGKNIDFSQKVQVASIQTLAKRIDNINGPKQKKRGRPSTEDENATVPVLDFSLVIIDEAHHALANTYRMLWDKWPKARFLGLTATPCRLNNAPFTDLFQALLQSWSIQEFIDKGWLSDFEYVSAAPNSAALMQIRKLDKRGADGDYQTKEMATVMDVPESIEHLYKTYQQFANGKKGIVYAIDREHARHITDYYQAQGVSCCLIDGKTPAEERKRMVNDYLDGKISVLTSIDCFSEGFDAPEVEFIQLARPTLSLSKYLQQVGRGMRVSSGKPHVLILDNVGLYQTFGLPTEERDWKKTFYGLSTGKGDASSTRYVVLNENGQEKELVNLEMVRIKKGGKKRAGLEIFLKDGRYGVMNNGKVSCPSRFTKIVRLYDNNGFFAAGIYSGMLYNTYVEYASLIDWKGIDLRLKLFRDVEWQDGIYYSYYKPAGYRKGDSFLQVYWDPKGNCYYDYDPAFRMVAGVEVAEAYEHNNREHICHKLRYSTGNLSPRFFLKDVFFNKHIIIARDYLIVKSDKNHAYHICGFLNNEVIVQKEDMSGYISIRLDGKKGEDYRSLPKELSKITPISYLYYVRELGLQCLWKSPPK